MKLSGWQRIGLLATILWVVGSLVIMFWLFEQEKRDWANALTEFCVSGSVPVEQCMEMHRDALATAATWRFPWPAYYIIGLAPVPLAWLLGWIILKLTRWIRRGFAVTDS